MLIAKITGKRSRKSCCWFKETCCIRSNTLIFVAFPVKLSPTIYLMLTESRQPTLNDLNGTNVQTEPSNEILHDSTAYP